MGDRRRGWMEIGKARERLNRVAGGAGSGLEAEAREDGDGVAVETERGRRRARRAGRDGSKGKGLSADNPWLRNLSFSVSAERWLLLAFGAALMLAAGGVQRFVGRRLNGE